MSVNLRKLHEMSLTDLKSRANELGIPLRPRPQRRDLAFSIAQKMGEQNNLSFGRGVLEVHGEGFGFLRAPEDNFLPGSKDIYVSQSQIRRFKLQTGDTVIGLVRPPKEGERYPALLRVESVNGDPPGVEPPSFETLTAIYPDERVPLAGDALLRSADWVAPLGLGQRGILRSPARTGRVAWLRRLVSILTKDEDLVVTALLVGERPEEIQEWRQQTTAEIIATPFDEPAARHVQVADITFERARRMVERGDDVVLLVDSLNRLLRACQSEITPSGRDVGGVDVSALHRMHRYMGSARALEEGGSLTVIGVLSCEPSNRSGRALYDDLSEVVNWELTLSRELADRGIRPPIEVHSSGTLRQERLLEPNELTERQSWRASLTGDPTEDGAALHAFLTARSSA